MINLIDISWIRSYQGTTLTEGNDMPAYFITEPGLFARWYRVIESYDGLDAVPIAKFFHREDAEKFLAHVREERDGKKIADLSTAEKRMETFERELTALIERTIVQDLQAPPVTLANRLIDQIEIFDACWRQGLEINTYLVSTNIDADPKKVAENEVSEY